MEGVARPYIWCKVSITGIQAVFSQPLAIKLRRPRVVQACGRLVGASLEGMESFWYVFKKLAAAFHCMLIQACS